MRIFIVAAMLGFMAGAAYAKDFDTLPETPKTIDERAYRDSVKRIPDKPVSSDPWGSVRNMGGTNNQTKKSPDSK